MRHYFGLFEFMIKECLGLVKIIILSKAECFILFSQSVDLQCFEVYFEIGHTLTYRSRLKTLRIPVIVKGKNLM